MVPDGPPESVWRTALDAALADTAGSEGDVSAPGDVDGASGVVDENAETGDQDGDVIDDVEPGGTVSTAWEDSSGTEPADWTERDDAGPHDY